MGSPINHTYVLYNSMKSQLRSASLVSRVLVRGLSQEIGIVLTRASVNTIIHSASQNVLQELFRTKHLFARSPMIHLVFIPISIIIIIIIIITIITIIIATIIIIN